MHQNDFQAVRIRTKDRVSEQLVSELSKQNWEGTSNTEQAAQLWIQINFGSDSIYTKISNTEIHALHVLTKNVQYIVIINEKYSTYATV